jgi:hypothetical protein
LVGSKFTESQLLYEQLEIEFLTNYQSPCKTMKAGSINPSATSKHPNR